MSRSAVSARDGATSLAVTKKRYGVRNRTGLELLALEIVGSEQNPSTPLRDARSCNVELRLGKGVLPWKSHREMALSP
jgi:hypothetical protein